MTITIDFFCNTDFVSLSRKDQQQQLTFLPEKFDPLILNSNNVHQYSRRGQAKVTTNLGEWSTGSINHEFIDDTQYEFYHEFRLSVRSGETFDISVDTAAISGHESNYFVFIPENQITITRFNHCNGFSFSFSFRTVLDI